MATPSKRTPLGWVLTVFGAIFVAITLALALLMAVPTMLGMQQLTVLTGSMEPAVPVGSLIYVAPAAPSELAEGDIVTFGDGEETVTHRVISNHKVEGELITKGDANAEEDLQPVPYSMVVGKVVLTLPGLGDVLEALASVMGKIYLIAFGACGVMLVILGGRLKKQPASTEAANGNDQ